MFYLAPVAANIEDPNVYERKAGNDTFDTNLSIRSGQILDHKYKVINLLGRESFGKTYLVLDEETKLKYITGGNLKFEQIFEGYYSRSGIDSEKVKAYFNREFFAL